MASSCWGRPAGACCAEEEEKEEEEQELGNALQEAVQWERESHGRGRGRGCLAGSIQLPSEEGKRPPLLSPSGHCPQQRGAASSKVCTPVSSRLQP